MEGWGWGWSEGRKGTEVGRMRGKEAGRKEARIEREGE